MSNHVDENRSGNTPIAKQNCPDCEAAQTEQYHGIYSFKCYGCRERLLLNEPCKMMREIMATSLRKWGEVPNWKVEPNCGCIKQCKRRQYQKG